MNRLSGRVAVVTGASSGIGAEIAQNLVRAGLIVVGVARRKDLLTALAASLAAEGARGRLEPIRADLTSLDDVRRVFQWVEDNLGGVSVLVNNAAILVKEPVHDLDAMVINKVITTNITAVMAGSKEAIGSMRRHNIKDGHIININSMAGHTFINEVNHPVSTTAYTTTKHAITALSKGLRFDVQKIKDFRIRVTSLSPGAVLTDMIPDDVVTVMGGQERLLKTKDVSDAVLYALACPPSVEITELSIQPTGEPF